LFCPKYCALASWLITKVPIIHNKANAYLLNRAKVGYSLFIDSFFKRKAESTKLKAFFYELKA